MPKITKATKPAFSLIEGKTQIEKVIASLQSRGKKYEQELHQCAVSCLNHAGLHGDITLARKLLAAIPAGMRKNALRDWFIAMGKFTWNAETKTLDFDKQKATLLEEAIVTPFWTFKPETDYVPFDLTKALNVLLARAKKAQEKGEIVPMDKLDAIAKIIA